MNNYETVEIRVGRVEALSFTSTFLRFYDIVVAFIVQFLWYYFVQEYLILLASSLSSIDSYFAKRGSPK